MSEDLARQIVTAVQRASADDPRSISAAIQSVQPGELASFFHATLVDEDSADELSVGLAASPGVATGKIALSAESAIAAADAGDDVILIRLETTPDDVLGMQAAAGLLTCRGGLVSHAAIVARGWGIPAVVGADEVVIQDDSVIVGECVLGEGDLVTIDGSTGKVYLGRIASTAAEPPPELEMLLGWADAVADGHVEVRANADTAGDAAVGRSMGAKGIGLCRTEHMFLAADRLPLMRRFILSDTEHAEAAALEELEAAQTADFESVLTEMDGHPVTVRLLDPPLHEFLPDLLDLTAREAAGEIDEEGRVELAAVRRLREVNPMLGTRGVRLGVMRTGIYQMQVRALCRAAASQFDSGRRPRVELMIPLVVDAEELRIARRWVTDVLDEIGHPELASDVVVIGAMIETPRAAITAGALAEHADFFSFGTNDLTQMTFAFSRDDVESRLLPAYQKLGILSANPFAVLDQQGVGELLRIACESARAATPGIKLGVCGEHAGDPESADFLVRLGIDSVSCSPFRIPLARLAVAQALLHCGRVDIGDVDFSAVAFSGVDSADVDSADADSADVDSAESDNGDEVPSATDLGPDSAETLALEPIEADEFLVLHVLRLRGFVTSEGFEESLGYHPASILESLIDQGQARYVEKREIYALLPPGRERHGAIFGAQADSSRAALAEPYQDFLEVNTELKALCSKWQMCGDEPNDHTDAAYDRQCIDELGRVGAAADSIIAALADEIPRLIRYGPRLQQAVRRLAGGDQKMFTGVACGSFHDIWMELHEDLIVLQGIDRTAEKSF